MARIPRRLAGTALGVLAAVVNSGNLTPEGLRQEDRAGALARCHIQDAAL